MAAAHRHYALKSSERKCVPLWSARRLVAAILLLPAVAVAFYCLTGTDAAQQHEYLTAPASTGDLVVRIAATATMRPLTQVDLSSELNGTMQSVHVRENQRVRRGDVLGRLDTATRTLDVEIAEAALKAAQARLGDARISLAEAVGKVGRALALSKKRVITPQKVEEATAARDRAANQVTAAEADLSIKQADLKQKRLDLARSTLRAPIDGVILARRTDPGQTVIASTQAPVLFTLAENLERMELIARINEADIGAIAKGQKATFTVDAFPGRVFRAEVSDVSYAHKSENNIVTYGARLEVDNSELLLRPGMTAAVSIVTGEAKGALLVSSSAFRYRPAGKEEAPGDGEGGARPVAGDRVYVLQEGTPRPVDVRRGIGDWQKTQVLSGLEEGAPVIVGEAGGPLAR
ncbi:efflux RND transporter periplasmic adaptor subunit [Nitratireductor sp. ZSWI3]|uniref:efflux RND transporter periplasmic adaptor subunit n=1 Tax=Nitratireductor sp. ZSWI3 TaxID=2966359 RepID=UPI002150464F|nr:efflux RND transporter periplasmic adaptor subunit [Nitratireductor sp. ZSWI3]MCR4268043.1 efflux RND transporter periplasmic adaptor subunit [Nitratireductor sp. ZSWI3]